MSGLGIGVQWCAVKRATIDPCVESTVARKTQRPRDLMSIQPLHCGWGLVVPTTPTTWGGTATTTWAGTTAPTAGVSDPADGAGAASTPGLASDTTRVDSNAADGGTPAATPRTAGVRASSARSVDHDDGA